VKYLLLINAGELDGGGDVVGCEPEDWMRFDKEIQGSGVVVAAESLADLVTSTRVQVANDGKRTVTDGPYAETREVLGGFYVIDVPDLDAALDWAAKCPGSRGGGSIDVRPVAELLGG